MNTDEPHPDPLEAHPDVHFTERLKDKPKDRKDWPQIEPAPAVERDPGADG